MSRILLDKVLELVEELMNIRINMNILNVWHYSLWENLLETSWNRLDDEHHKIACISVIQEYLNSPNLLKKYLKNYINTHK